MRATLSPDPPPARAEPPRRSASRDESARPSSRHARLLRVVHSILTSTFTHVALLAVLAFVSLEADPSAVPPALTSTALVPTELEPTDPSRIDQPDQPQHLADEAAEIFALLAATETDAAITAGEFADTATLSFSRDDRPLGFESFSSDELATKAGTISGFSGRTGDARADLLARRGGTQASEAAVARGLAWIAAHQLPNGSWRFDHRRGECNDRCRNPGLLNACTTGATALALLPMYGAGHTHQQGDYQQVVDRGLRYLVSRFKSAPFGASLVESGGLYDHGIATILLCEAYAMTGDSWLREPAQRAIDFVVYAQDPRGGGWRYQPRARGDTSVVGWQFMALKSAQMAGLEVPTPTLQGVDHFLNSVQTKRGAAYGYTDPGFSSGTNAIGLLCRMYLGWEQDHPSLAEGVEVIAREGPSSTDVYFNYYATQLLHHFDGESWPKWNAQLRDVLIATQSTSGHERGSWYTEDVGQASQLGGRLYTTSLSIMTLEVYYRHLPIYDRRSVEAGPNAEAAPNMEAVPNVNAGS